MRKEYHVDSAELAHFDEYESEFNECYTPGPSCAIRIWLPGPEELYKYYFEEWRKIMIADLRALGAEFGDQIWIEIDY